MSAHISEENKTHFKWLVAIYIVADNDLSDAAIDDVREIESAARCDEIAVIYEIDRRTIVNGEVVHEAKRRQTSPSYTVKDTKYPNINFQNVIVNRALPAFYNHCVETYDAENYLFILWGHARRTSSDITLNSLLALEKREIPAKSGLKNILEPGARRQLQNVLGSFFMITPEDKPWDALTICQLKETAKKVNDKIKSKGKDRKFILGLDTCLLSSAEVCYELRGCADFVISSEGRVPESSWNYKEILTSLCDKQNADDKLFLPAAQPCHKPRRFV